MKADEMELRPLVDLTARLGRQPLLVQASTGNTSIKIGDTLWIKASGKWMANAEREDTFVAVKLADRQQFISGRPASSQTSHGAPLKPSVETAMHLTLPHRVVIHVHSVNTIAWAVQRDGYAYVSERLKGLSWRWIRYVPSGAPLANEIAASLQPSANVFVLANHGLVVCGDSCEDAQAHLQEVERRLEVVPRETIEPDIATLTRLASLCGDFQPPDLREIHSLAIDLFSLSVFSAGILYPCQALFLGRSACIFPEQDSLRSVIQQYSADNGFRPPVVLVPGKGVLVPKNLTSTESQMLLGLSHVVRRVRPGAGLSYLDEKSVHEVLGSGNYAEVRRSSRPAANYASV